MVTTSRAMNEMVKDNKEEGVFQMSKTEIILRDELTRLGEEQIALRKVRDKTTIGSRNETRCSRSK